MSVETAVTEAGLMEAFARAKAKLARARKRVEQAEALVEEAENKLYRTERRGAAANEEYREVLRAIAKHKQETGSAMLPELDVHMKPETLEKLRELRADCERALLGHREG